MLRLVRCWEILEFIVVDNMCGSTITYDIMVTVTIDVYILLLSGNVKKY